MATNSRFGMLLKDALARRGWDQKDLCEALPRNGERPISESNISAWNARGWAPEKRMLEMVALLPDSEFAKAWEEGGLRKIPQKSMDLFGPPAIHPDDDTEAPTKAAPSQVANSAFEEEIRQHMPVGARKNWQSTPFRAGVFSFGFDYVSPTAVIEFKNVKDQILPASAYRAVLDLAVASRMLEGDRRYGLLLVLPEDGYVPVRGFPGFTALQQKAMLLGVEVAAVVGAELAAAYVEMWENGQVMRFKDEDS